MCRNFSFGHADVIMFRNAAASGDNEVLAMADCAINITPNEDELVEIAPMQPVVVSAS